MRAFLPRRAKGSGPRCWRPLHDDEECIEHEKRDRHVVEDSCYCRVTTTKACGPKEKRECGEEGLAPLEGWGSASEMEEEGCDGDQYERQGRECAVSPGREEARSYVGEQQNDDTCKCENGDRGRNEVVRFGRLGSHRRDGTRGGLKKRTKIGPIKRDSTIERS